MFWFILFVVSLAVGLVLHMIYEIPFEAILGVPVLLIAVIVSSIHYTDPNGNSHVNCTTSVVETQPLVSINDGQEISGHYFLGTGSVSTDMKFYSYVQGDDGFITLFELPKDTKFKTTSGEAYYEKIKVTGIESFWFFNMVDETEYIVYVPEGSFINDYCFDLQ